VHQILALRTKSLARVYGSSILANCRFCWRAKGRNPLEFAGNAEAGRKSAGKVRPTVELRAR
jgi:hypothetical protein